MTLHLSFIRLVTFADLRHNAWLSKNEEAVQLNSAFPVDLMFVLWERCFLQWTEQEHLGKLPLRSRVSAIQFQQCRDYTDNAMTLIEE